jgi:hypothetical protein
MKAVAVNPRKREVSLIDHPAPKISAPTEVKFRTLEVGHLRHGSRNLPLRLR